MSKKGGDKYELDDEDDASSGIGVGPDGIKAIDAPKSAEKVNEWELFIAVIKEGFGFSKACEVSENDIAKLSALIKKDKKLYAAIKSHGQGFLTTQLTAAAALDKKGSYAQADDRRDAIRRYAGLNLWESDCKKAEVTPNTIARVYGKLREPREVATCCGMSYDEYVRYVIEHSEVITATIGVPGTELI